MQYCIVLLTTGTHKEIVSLIFLPLHSGKLHEEFDDIISLVGCSVLYFIVVHLPMHSSEIPRWGVGVGVLWMQKIRSPLLRTQSYQTSFLAWSRW